MEWIMRNSNSHTERSIAIWTLGSGVGSRVTLSLGRKGVSSSRRSSSNLGGNRDIDGQAEEMQIQDGSAPVAQFISPALHTGSSTAFS